MYEQMSLSPYTKAYPKLQNLFTELKVNIHSCFYMGLISCDFFQILSLYLAIFYSTFFPVNRRADAYNLCQTFNFSNDWTFVHIHNIYWHFYQHEIYVLVLKNALKVLLYEKNNLLALSKAKHEAGTNLSIWGRDSKM